MFIQDNTFENIVCEMAAILSRPQYVNRVRHLAAITGTTVLVPYHFNSLWPGDAIWWQRSGITLVQVIAWCCQAPRHYLNQCWLFIRKLLRHSSESNFTLNTQLILFFYKFEIYTICHMCQGSVREWSQYSLLVGDAFYQQPIFNSLWPNDACMHQ